MRRLHRQAHVQLLPLGLRAARRPLQVRRTLRLARRAVVLRLGCDHRHLEGRAGQVYVLNVSRALHAQSHSATSIVLDIEMSVNRGAELIKSDCIVPGLPTTLTSWALFAE
eukprot:6105145-Prymnesium_polylepis.1